MDVHLRLRVIDIQKALSGQHLKKPAEFLNTGVSFRANSASAKNGIVIRRSAGSEVQVSNEILRKRRVVGAFR